MYNKMGLIARRFKLKLSAAPKTHPVFLRLLLAALLVLGTPLATLAYLLRRRPQVIVAVFRRLFLPASGLSMDWFGRASIEFTHSRSPMKLRKKDGTETDIFQVVEKSVPLCQLNPLLFNGHLQTMWTVAKSQGPQIYWKRRLFEADHKIYNGIFAVDFVVHDKFDTVDKSLPPRTVYYTDDEFAAMASTDNRPTLIVLHGLSGGSYEIYLRAAVDPLVKSGKWEVCVLNARGCAKTAITSGVLFNARATWDLRQLINWLQQRYPNRPLFALGFSLGANIMTNYCGEEGSDCPLKAAVSVGNPFNLELASRALQRTLIGKEVYQRVMGTNMKKLINLHKEQIETHTELDLKEINKITYLFEFDRAVQCETWGYPTEESYYRDASSSDSLLAVRIPFMAVAAKDDPIAVEEAIPYQEFKQNPCAVLCRTSLGGHLSWFEMGGGRWHAKPISNFLNAMAFEVDLDSVSPQQIARTIDIPKRGAHFDPIRRKLDIILDD